MKELKLIILFTLVNFVLLFTGVLLLPDRQEQQAVQATGGAEPANAAPAENAAVMPQPKPQQQAAASQPKPQPAVPVSQPAAQPVPSPATQPATDRCVITVSGKRYDVTEFRLQHSGGDVFRCGADNTQLFFSQHEQRLLDTTMRRYLAQ